LGGQDGALRLVAGLALLLLAVTAARAADRRVVVDPDEPPWTAVAKVQTNTGVHCTGVLVAPAMVVTAAHCLFNARTHAMLRPVSLHVLFGYARDRYRWHRYVARVVVGAGFNGLTRRPQPGDWARLQLAASVPVAPLPLFGGTIAPGLPVALAGYNEDRAQLLMVDPACSLLRVVLVRGGVFVLHDCEGTVGTSGAPLLTRVVGAWAVLGINIAAGRFDNLALVIPPFAGR
jgi:protease YdgD